MRDHDDMIGSYLDGKLSGEVRREFERRMQADPVLEREVRAERMIRQTLRNDFSSTRQTLAKPSSVIVSRLKSTSRISAAGFGSGGGPLGTIFQKPVRAGFISVVGIAALVLGGHVIEPRLRDSIRPDQKEGAGIRIPSVPDAPEAPDVVEGDGRRDRARGVGFADRSSGAGSARKDKGAISNGDENAAPVAPIVSPMEERRAYALRFDGDDYVDVGNPPELHLSDALTLEAWVNPQVEYYNAVMCKGDAWYGIDFANSKDSVKRNGIKLRPGFFFPTLTIDFDGTEEYWEKVLLADTIPEGDRSHLGCVEAYWGRALLPGAVPEGEWTHLACTYDAKVELINIYVNGERRASLHATGKIRGDSGSFRIGARQPDVPKYQEYFHGDLDEIRVWNKARTEEEIRADMNRRLTGDENGLVAYYSFDHKPGQSTQDEVGENHGRLGAGPEEDRQDPSWIESELPH